MGYGGRNQKLKDLKDLGTQSSVGRPDATVPPDSTNGSAGLRAPLAYIPSVPNGQTVARGSPRQVPGPYVRVFGLTGHLRDVECEDSLGEGSHGFHGLLVVIKASRSEHGVCG